MWGRIGRELSKKQARALDGPRCVLFLPLPSVALSATKKYSTAPPILAKNFHLSEELLLTRKRAKKFLEFDNRNF
jgi:hypothetical protein